MFVAYQTVEIQLTQPETDLIDQAEQFDWLSLINTLRGGDHVTAITLVAVVGDLRRFLSARQLMAYVGSESSEYSSGRCQRRGTITKFGNATV